MTENPFDPYNPALPPRFFGRKAELLALESSLAEGHGVSLVGDWRIGKTSLLRTWELRARELGRRVAFLDGQGPEGNSPAALVARVVQQPAPESADGAANLLGEWVAVQPGGLAPVLLIDELDGLVPRFDPRFFDRLREMLGRLIVAVASRRPVDLLYHELGRTSPFDNRLALVQLGLLAGEAADALAAAGGELGPEHRELLRRWAGRHPFHLQLFGHHLVAARRVGQSRRDALDRYLDEAGARFRELWARLSPREQEALREAAAGRPTPLRSLRRRGLVGDNGLPFGEVLGSWLREESE